jgi:hypothetical protein
MRHALCKWCGFRWQLQPSDPLPGKALACPKCGHNGSTVVLDFDPQTEMPL